MFISRKKGRAMYPRLWAPNFWATNLVSQLTKQASFWFNFQPLNAMKPGTFLGLKTLT